MTKRKGTLSKGFLLLQEKEVKMTDQLLLWYDRSARALPWRENKDPYRVWLSEIMLQQTRVDTVVEYYNAWLQIFPTIEKLAQASEDQVLKQWQGLGYYNRARNFHRAAKIIIEEKQSQFPQSVDEWRKLPGVGEYTAAAIASIAFNQVIPVFDGNVIRVISRILGLEQDPASKEIRQRMVEKSMQWISQNRPGDYNQAMMELGATICLPNGKPLCTICPISAHCKVNGTEQWRVIPLKKEKTLRKIENRTVFLLCDHNRVMIQKRKSKGLLGNLWELPNLEGHLSGQQVTEWLQLNHFTPLRMKLVEKHFKHVFTHLDWQMQVWIIELKSQESYTDLHWLKIGDLNHLYAIPTAFSAILNWFANYQIKDK